MLFSELCLNWLEYKRCSNKASTISTYMKSVEKNIIPFLGYIDCDNLEEKNIICFINSLNKTDYSEKYKQDIIVILKSIIKYGNMAKIFNLNLSLIPCPRASNKKVEVLSHQEVKNIIDYMENHESYKNIGIYIGLYTGMRVGEICALKWEDIDMLQQKIYVNKTMQRIYVERKKTEVVILKPKSENSIREMPISTILNNILVKNYKKQGYVLTGSSKYVEPRCLQKYFQKLTSELGCSKNNFHILRHTFATQCIECGVDIKSLSEILGHASVSMTLNKYVHSSFDTKTRQLKKLSY